MKKIGSMAQNSTPSHPLQSEAWGKFRETMGIDVVRCRWQGPKPAEGQRPEPAEGQLTFHRIPRTPWTIGYFPKGPKPTRGMIAALTKLGQEKRAIFIQIEPNVAIHAPSRLRLPQLRPSHHPLFTKYTFILDLTKSEEELLKAMHSKTRYNLKIAAKHGVSVQLDNSEKAFRQYIRLNEETTGRQGFYAHNRRYHETMWDIMRSAGIAHMFTATYQGKTLAAWIIFAWNKTLYYPYGTSSRENRETMAPTLLLWEIAKWGKAHGFAAFDLWGAIGPAPDPHDPWYGFHRFKQGFAPQLIEFIGSYDLVINPLVYNAYKIADKLRWGILTLRKKF